MKEVSISRERLYAQLRFQGIKHLGQVKRLYIEANGTFTLIKTEEPSAGLSIIPNWDTELINLQKKSVFIKSCLTCGYGQSINHIESACPSCGKYQWSDAIENEKTYSFNTDYLSEDFRY